MAKCVCTASPRPKQKNVLQYCSCMSIVFQIWVGDMSQGLIVVNAFLVGTDSHGGLRPRSFRSLAHIPPFGKLCVFLKTDFLTAAAASRNPWWLVAKPPGCMSWSQQLPYRETKHKRKDLPCYVALYFSFWCCWDSAASKTGWHAAGMFNGKWFILPFWFLVHLFRRHRHRHHRVVELPWCTRRCYNGSALPPRNPQIGHPYILPFSPGEYSCNYPRWPNALDIPSPTWAWLVLFSPSSPLKTVWDWRWIAPNNNIIQTTRRETNRKYTGNEHNEWLWDQSKIQRRSR